LKVDTVQLGELATVIGGYAFKSRDFVDRQGVPVVKIANITSNGVDLSNSLFLPDEFLSVKDKFHVNNGDVLISLTGSQLSQPNSVVGRVARYSYEYTALLNQRVGKLISNDQGKCDIRFVYYFLKQGTVTYQLAINAKGSANQANISGADVERLRIPAFSIAQQDCIASILSAYDDLIENNRRRMQLLEQAARLLYKEWFFHLRFPGHENVKIKDGVPEGWKKKPLCEITDITMGQSPQSVYYNEDGNGLPFHQGVTNFGVRFPARKTYCTVQGRLAESGDILFSVRAPVGRINITNDKIVIGRGLAAIRSILGQQNLLFYALKSHFFKEDMIGGGAIFAAITKKDLYGVELLQSPDSVAQMFMEHVRPIDLQIENLDRAIEKLTELRDLLLPRLMNGEVAV